MGRSWRDAGMVVMREAEAQRRKSIALYQKDAFWKADNGHSMPMSHGSSAVGGA